jgi:hypothetical protein
MPVWFFVVLLLVLLFAVGLAVAMRAGRRLQAARTPPSSKRTRGRILDLDKVDVDSGDRRPMLCPGAGSS